MKYYSLGIFIGILAMQFTSGCASMAVRASTKEVGAVLNSGVSRDTIRARLGSPVSSRNFTSPTDVSARVSDYQGRIFVWSEDLFYVSGLVTTETAHGSNRQFIGLEYTPIDLIGLPFATVNLSLEATKKYRLYVWYKKDGTYAWHKKEYQPIE